eukprot:SAG22_NODE_346_length_11892_cov_40.205970_2_plen_164_part_00
MVRERSLVLPSADFCSPLRARRDGAAAAGARRTARIFTGGTEPPPHRSTASDLPKGSRKKVERAETAAIAVVASIVLEQSAAALVLASLPERPAVGSCYWLGRFDPPRPLDSAGGSEADMGVLAGRLSRPAAGMTVSGALWASRLCWLCLDAWCLPFGRAMVP